MHGARSFVDVPPVRGVAHHDDLGARAAEDVRCDPVRGTESGVEHDAFSAEAAGRNAAEEERFVLFDELGRAGERRVGNEDVVAPERAELVLDLLFDRVGNLHPVMSEDLHAVIFERIVRRGDRETGGSV